ncbi:hypothetical protein [Roseixanthobacter glucoisosaccharinicivorans]|uniref:hypothetical protein n=1 Tax=Roseixanthobacter glucoisosaccharinicivorans TaxID=3119923 RepID=UPI00372B0D2D
MTIVERLSLGAAAAFIAAAVLLCSGGAVTMDEGARFWIFVVAITVVMNSLAIDSLNRRINRMEGPSFFVHLDSGKAYRITPIEKD